MKKKLMLTLIILTLLLGTVSAEEKFLVDATFYNDNSAEINSVKIIDASRTTSLRHVTENFTIQGVNKENQSLKQGSVPLSFINYVRTTEGGYEEEKERITKRIFLEYNRNITKIKILHEGTEKAEYNLITNLCSNFDNTCISYCDSKGVDVDCTCGDDICQKPTNEKELCPEDCSIPQDSESVENSTENQTKEVVDSNYSNYILIAIIVAAVVVGLFFLSGKVKIEA